MAKNIKISIFFGKNMLIFIFLRFRVPKTHLIMSWKKKNVQKLKCIRLRDMDHLQKNNLHKMTTVFCQYYSSTVVQRPLKRNTFYLWPWNSYVFSTLNRGRFKKSRPLDFWYHELQFKLEKYLLKIFEQGQSSKTAWTSLRILTF